MEPNSSAYHIPDAHLINGPLDLELLERSLRAVADRHELLRTTLRLIDGKPVQVVVPTSQLTVATIDRRGLTEIEQEAEIERQIKENSAVVFDLARGPLLQLKVVRLAHERCLLLVNMHHVVSDDWSLGVFYRELSLFYTGFVSGQPVELPPLPIQYADYAVCQRQWLEGGELERQLVYWRRQLAGTPTLELPTDFPRPPKQTFVGSRIPFTLSRDLTARLKDFDRQQNATHFMSLLAAFQVLLSRYSGQTDIVIGTPIANRRHVELEGLFGFFVNMLVLRGDLNDEPSFREVVSRVRRTALDAYENQDLPFDRLVEDLNPERDLSRQPLFQVMFAIQDVPTQPLTFPGIQVARRVHDVHATHFDLELYLATEGDAWSGFIAYNSDLFAPTTIERMIGHYQTLLHSVLAEPDCSIYKAAMLTDAERDQLQQWTGKSVDFGPTECIHQLFEEQVVKSPGSVAVEFKDQTFTYQELNLRADQLAAEIQKLGFGPEARIGVCVERSLDMVVAMFAVLKAGGAYVPVDIHFPPDRIALILNDAGVELLILHDSLRPLCAGFSGKSLSLDRPLTTSSADLRKPSLSGHNAAYIYFTSGSTGRPKGVVIEHRSVVNLVRAMQREPGISHTDVMLAVTTMAFDPTVVDVFLPLSVGARVVIAPDAVRLDPDQLLELLHRSGTTLVQATPTMWQLLMRSEWTRKELRAVIGGEGLTPEVARDLLDRCGELWNHYGPTEATVWSTLIRIETADDLTIGRPFPNYRVYLVDRHHERVPVGVPGELWIGGAGLGRHYVGQPELTAERFIPDPFVSKPGEFVYRTGDVCRYRPDGRIEFLARLDNQIKIRGFRVELGEIETLLLEHPDISQCVVVDRIDSSGERRLIGYIVPANPSSVPDITAVREFLKPKLPDFMVPSAFVSLEKFPLTSTGKVARKALPDPEPVRRDLDIAEHTPRNQVERQVAHIWEAILHIEGIGLTDDFFQIGGHSLMAVRLMAEINITFGTALPLATIFRSPTIEHLAVAILNSHELQLKPPGLIAPREGETGQPIFWAPSVGSVERYVECHNLARLLRGHYRFYGFDPAPEIRDISSLARHCLRLIQAEQPHGPYFLAGYCQCGHVAYEIATRLERDGEEVALLAIIDASARDFGATFRQRLYWVCDGLRGNPGIVFHRMRSVVHRKLGTPTTGVSGLVANNGQPMDRFVAHALAVKQHKVSRFSGPIDLIRSEEWLASLPHAPLLGWNALAPTVRVHPVNCDHSAVLKDPISIKRIVDTLKQSLACPSA